jgi:hypothetical protein
MSSPAPIQRLGPYELIASIRKGGMGEVSRAVRPRTATLSCAFEAGSAGDHPRAYQLDADDPGIAVNPGPPACEERSGVALR